MTYGISYNIGFLEELKTIIQNQDAQARGYEVGADNLAVTKDLLNVADGAMGGITDYCFARIE